MVTEPLWDSLVSIAQHHDARIGVTDLEPFTEVRNELDRRIATGASAGLGFTFTDPATATEPRRSFPWARSLVVVAVPYLTDGDGDDGHIRSVARFADGDRYEPLRTVLAAVSEAIGRAGHRTETVYDDDRLVDRAVAVRAGVAWQGKSTMALTPGHGPWILIGTVVTDAGMESTAPMHRTCGTCDACIPACPTGAIVAPGVLDARRCLAAVFQSRGDIPRDLREAAGERVYGCDDCLTSCPPGHHALGIHAASRGPDPVELLTRSDTDLDAAFSHWYVPGRAMRFVRRNALVAVGNRGRANDVGLLSGYLGHPDDLLRSHAAWGLGRIGGPEAIACLDAAARTESVAEVRQDIEQARDTASGRLR